MADSTKPDDRPGPTTTWPDLAISLYDLLSGRGAEIVYEFDDLEVDVPSGTGEDAERARWRLDGELRVKTKERD